MYPNQPVKSVVDSIHLTHWTIGEFKLVFLFSERILTEIKKLSCLPNWYEDPITAATYIDRLNTCFISIDKYYKVFGTLPQLGYRLYDEDTGMLIQECSIDGELMTITFTLSL